MTAEQSPICNALCSKLTDPVRRQPAAELPARFQAIGAALEKSATGSGVKQYERDLAIQQIVSRAVVSTEIIDILKAAGINSPDISILSDEFLAEVAQMDHKNLALEALRKLINDGIRSRSKSNVVQTKLFSDRLEEAVARYHANAITTAQVIQGDELDSEVLADDARRFRERYPDWRRFGVSGFLAQRCGRSMHFVKIAWHGSRQLQSLP